MSVRSRQLAQEPGWAVPVRLPRWEPAFRELLLAAGIDPFRSPSEPVAGPVDLPMLLIAASETAAQAAVLRALPEILTPWDFPLRPGRLGPLPDPHEPRGTRYPPYRLYPD